MQYSDDAAVIWRKAAASNPSGACVELAALPDGLVGIRNSRDPAGPRLTVRRSVVAAFVRAARAGEFDDVPR